MFPRSIILAAVCARKMTTVARGAFKRAKTLVAIDADTAESERLKEDAKRKQNWKRWGPYLSERQWATVREDYSGDGSWWVGSTQGWYCTRRQRHALGKHRTRCNLEVTCSRPAAMYLSHGTTATNSPIAPRRACLHGLDMDCSAVCSIALCLPEQHKVRGRDPLPTNQGRTPAFTAAPLDCK